MSITIKPFPFALLMLAIVIWLFKPHNAVVAAPVVAQPSQNTVPSPEEVANWVTNRSLKKGQAFINERIATTR